MGARGRLLGGLFVSTALVVSCSSTPEQLVLKHSRRGDEYMQKKKFSEAVIEYRNAVKAGPNDGKLHWKLAQAALEARDIRTAFGELRKTVELDPSNHDALEKLGEIYVVAGKIDEAAQIADNLARTRPKDPEGHILKSSVAIRRGRIDEAIGHLRRAVELDPNRSRPMLALGNLHLLKRDRKTAMAWYDRALAVEPNDPAVHITRGNCFFAAGERDEGEKSYRKAIELSKDKETVRIALAEHYMFQGRMEESEKELQAVIRELNSQRARKVLAETKVEMGKVAEARDLADAILKENPKDLDGKFLKGRVALAEKRLDDAKALFGEVVKGDAGMARARLYNGMTDVLLGQVEVGKKEIQEAVRLDPGNAKARLVLGNLYLRTNAPAEAEREATEVLQRNPSNLQAALLFGDACLLRKDYGKAEQVFGAIVRQVPRSSVGYFKMGMSRKAQRKPAEAASYFAQAVERSPADVASVGEYVFALTAARQADKAGRIVDEYLEKNPGEPRAWEMAGRFHLAAGRPERAEAAFLKAVELAPDYAPAYYDLAVLYVSQRKVAEAEARLRMMIEKNDRSAAGHALLGLVLNSQGRIDDSNAQYRRALQLAPKHVFAANNLAQNLADHGGNLDEALKFAQVAREAAPEDPFVSDTLGWIYYRKGLFDAAYPLVAESSRKLGQSAVARYHHGMVLAKKGRKKEAAAELSAALALDGKFPGADEAKKTLASLR